MTIDERKEAFKKELDLLLKKYDVDICLEQRGKSYMHYDVIVADFAHSEESGYGQIEFGSNISKD